MCFGLLVVDWIAGLRVVFCFGLLFLFLVGLVSLVCLLCFGIVFIFVIYGFVWCLSGCWLLMAVVWLYLRLGWGWWFAIVVLLIVLTCIGVCGLFVVVGWF